MRRLVLTSLIAAGLMLAFAPDVTAQVRQMEAALNGGEETPPINTGAFGTAEVSVDLNRRTINYRVRVWNFPTGATVGHFHAGAEDTPGPVIINLNVPSGATDDFEVSGTATQADFVPRPEKGIHTWDDALQAVVGSNTYINIHSMANPTGEIRGQVLPKN